MNRMNWWKESPNGRRHPAPSDIGWLSQRLRPVTGGGLAKVPTLLAPTRPRERSLEVRFTGQATDVAVRWRPGNDGDLLLCLHGFGCAKESFDSGFEVDCLADVGICTVDLPGHGASGWLPEVPDVIEAYAQVVEMLVRELSPQRLFLLGHSMGGAVGLVASQLVSVDGFLNVEGNLVAADCGLVTRQTAAQARVEFITTGYDRFLAELEGSDQPALRQWARWYKQAEPATLHRLAGSLLACFYGCDSDVSHLFPGLDGMATYPVADAGHFPMVDNPDEFWQAVADALGR